MNMLIKNINTLNYSGSLPGGAMQVLMVVELPDESLLRAERSDRSDAL